MALEIILSGNPKGQSLSDPSASDYIRNLYGLPKGQRMMLVEIRRTNAGTFCFYTYYFSHNLSDMGGRPNGYFALTLQLNGQVCSDISAVYAAMESTFANKVLGKIIQRSADQYRYIVPEFKATSREVEETEQSLYSQINTMLAGNIAPIDSSFLLQKAETEAVNPGDADNTALMEQLRRTGRVILSPDVLPAEQLRRLRREEQARVQAEENLRRQKAEEEERLRTATLRAVEAERMRVNAEIDNLRAAISQKDETIRAVNGEYLRMTETLKSLNERLAKTENALAAQKPAAEAKHSGTQPNPGTTSALDRRIDVAERKIAEMKRRGFLAVCLVAALLLIFAGLLFFSKGETSGKWDTAFTPSTDRLQTDTKVNIGTGEEIEDDKYEAEESTYEQRRRYYEEQTRAYEEEQLRQAREDAQRRSAAAAQGEYDFRIDIEGPHRTVKGNVQWLTGDKEYTFTLKDRLSATRKLTHAEKEETVWTIQRVGGERQKFDNVAEVKIKISEPGDYVITATCQDKTVRRNDFMVAKQ